MREGEGEGRGAAHRGERGDPPIEVREEEGRGGELPIEVREGTRPWR